MDWLLPTVVIIGLAFAAWIGYDLLQRKHATERAAEIPSTCIPRNA